MGRVRTGRSLVGGVFRPNYNVAVAHCLCVIVVIYTKVPGRTVINVLLLSVVHAAINRNAALSFNLVPTKQIDFGF